ncbi:MAG TPA: hypothetical protein VEG32_05735 [Clostridia bacterium]|nr:hypothetical protein [Clostridia bacterium]
MKDLKSAIAEKRSALEEHRSAIRRIEADLEALTTALKIIENDESTARPGMVPSNAPMPNPVIRKAFP